MKEKEKNIDTWKDEFSTLLTELSDCIESENESHIVEDAILKRFERVFDVAWKSMRTYFAQNGLFCTGAQACLVQAKKREWVEVSESQIQDMVNCYDALQQFQSPSEDRAFVKNIVEEYYPILKALFTYFDEELSKS